MRGGVFGSADTIEVLLKKGSQTELFKKSDFLDHSLTDVGYGTTVTDPEIAKNPDAFFRITVTVKEETP